MNPQDFPQLSFPFTASHLPEARAIWISERYAKGASADYKEFVDRFAYLVPGGATFDGLSFDIDRTELLSGERYGGGGIGSNGGGARCGNIDGYQVKGVGKNLLAGDADIHHTYGGFKAAYAIHEAIYSQTLSQLLPVGVAHIFGVMLTGPRAAFVKGTNRGWGGMLVREPVLRPASFLRAGLFSLPQEQRSDLLSDVWRVRSVNRALLLEKGVNGVVQLFGKFLANSADQFTFARLAGLMHGALTPSNLCMDGRWIDLTNTTFLCTSKNWAGGNRQTASFQEELREPLRFVAALAETFGRFTGKVLNVKPLAAYYEECLVEGFRAHLDYVFGLPRGPFSAGYGPLLDKILRYVLSSTENVPTVYDSWPIDPPIYEPTFEAIAKLFVAACSNRGSVLSVDSDEFGLGQREIVSFRNLILSCKGAKPTIGSTKQSFLVGCAIASAKRLLLNAFFYKGRIETQVNGLLDSNKIENLQAYVADTIASSQWIFSRALESRVDLFKSTNMIIQYDLRAEIFEVKSNGGGLIQFASARELSIYIDRVDSCELFSIDDFDFIPYLKRVLSLIQMMSAEAEHAQRN